MKKKKTASNATYVEIGVYEVNDLAPSKIPLTPIRMELIESAILWVQQGKTLRDWCRLPGHPGWTAIHNWINQQPEVKERFKQAREIGMDAIAEETLAMVDESPERIQEGRIDPGWVQWKRMQVEQRIKLMAKWYPSKYGDKVGVEHGGNVSINVVTGVPELPEEIIPIEAKQKQVIQIENEDGQD